VGQEAVGGGMKQLEVISDEEGCLRGLAASTQLYSGKGRRRGEKQFGKDRLETGWESR